MQRVFSTLGNPNYLAGLVLMVLPLMHETLFVHKGQHKALWDIILWVIGGILIYWTGSYLAWIFFALYVFIILMNHVIAHSRHRYIFWTLFALLLLSGVCFVLFQYHEEILALQKMQ